MSNARTNVLFIVALNAVVAALLVAAGLTVLAPEPVAGAPPATDALEARLKVQEQETEALRARCEKLEAELATANSRIGKVEAARARIAAAGAAPEVEAGPEGAAPAPAPGEEDPLARSFREMMKQQLERQRARFIDQIVNPTEESREEAARQSRRMAEQISRRMGLDERDAKQVERILSEVDARRREKLRTLFTSKSNPEDVTYPEVKEVLDESYAEEDRLIAETLPRDKADGYQEAAQPIRGFVDGMAKAAFPPGPDGDR